MDKANHERIAWLDIAKGIGILLVVIGHCTHLDGKVFQWIFMFHMPMFFFFSGYVFKSGRPFLPYLKRRARSLLVPFVGYFLLGLIVTLILPVWREGLTWDGIMNDLLVGSPRVVNNTSIWYLLCLFFVSLVFWAVDRAPICVQVSLIFAAYLVAVWLGKARPEALGCSRLPLTLDVVPMAVVFFALGVYARQGGTVERVVARADASLLMFVLGAVCIVLIHQDNGYVNMNARRYGEPFLYVLGGLAGTASVIGFSGLVVRLCKPPFSALSQTLRWYGQNSLTILGVQSLLIRLYIVVVQAMTGVKLLMNHFPWEHVVVSAALVGLVACPIVCFIQHGAKRLWNKRRIT